MCLAVPLEIVELTAGRKARVRRADGTFEIDVSLLASPRVGDFVLVHAGFAIETLEPDELARFTDQVCRAGLARGLFLSSGVTRRHDAGMERMLATAEILRHKLGFRGYIHLKIMPGAERAQVEQAMRLADRVSINLEAPNTDRLHKLAPRKQFIEELLQPLPQRGQPSPSRAAVISVTRWAV